MPDDDPQFQEPEPTWVGLEDQPLEFANTFSGIVGPNAVFVNIGSAVPPAIETEEDILNMRFIPVRPIARIALAPGGLDDLIRTLENTRRIYEELKRIEEDE
ncbi:MAG TPA: hypothetical protein VFX44_08870 [Solirubrobacterales bacterium]|nr:hypothetical protein [Solirubrobacterales bacterium]